MFTKPVRIEIRERAQNRSELSGENNRPLVCAHLRHRGGMKNRRKRTDFSHNGLLVTDIEHLAHHKLFKNIPDKIGLSTEHNDVSIISLTRNVAKFNKENKIPDYIVQEKYENSVKAWLEFYDNKPEILGFSQKKNDEIVTSLIQEINKDNSDNIPLTKKIKNWE